MRIEHDGVSCARNGNLSVDDRRCARKREQPRFNASLLEHLNQQVGASLEIRMISCDIRYREEFAELLRQLRLMSCRVLVSSLRRRLRRKRTGEPQQGQT